MDLVELIGDLAEGFGESRVEGGVELFVDGGAHLFELGGVVGVEPVERLADGGAKALLVGGVGLGELAEAAVQAFTGLVLILAGFGGGGCHALGDELVLLVDVGLEAGGGLGVVGAEAGELGVEGVAEGGDGVGDLGAELGEGTGVGLAGDQGVVAGLAAEFGQAVAQVQVETFVPRVQAVELVGKLGVARVGVGGGACGPGAEPERGDGEEEQDLKDEEDDEHVRFSFAIG